MTIDEAHRLDLDDVFVLIIITCLFRRLNSWRHPLAGVGLATTLPASSGL
jgi:hypothetical protein